MHSHVTFRRFSDLDELAAHKKEWNNLLLKTDADRLFMSFEWILAWWRHFGATLELFTYFVYVGGKLAGILPLAIRKKEAFRQLVLLGVGKSDYLDFIVMDDYWDQCLTVFYDEVLKGDGKWDIFLVSKLVEEKRTYQHLSASLIEKEPGGTSICRFGCAPYLKIDSGWDEYLSKMRKKTVADSRRQIRRLENEVGKISYKSELSYDEANSLYQTFLQYHRVRREAVKKDYSMFGDERNVAFYIDTLKGLTGACTTHFSVLYSSNLPVSMHLGFVADNRFYYQVPVFNEAFEKYSVGRILLMRLLEEAFSKGFDEFDFGYGREPYKYDFASGERALMEIVFARKTFRGRLGTLWFQQLRKRLKKTIFIAKVVYPKMRGHKLVKDPS